MNVQKLCLLFNMWKFTGDQWHDDIQGILGKPAQKRPPASTPPDRSFCQRHKSNKSNLCSKLLNVIYNYYIILRKWNETIFILLDEASS